MTFLEGASDEEIKALPKYRFHQDNPLEPFDSDKKQELGMTLESGYNGHTTEHALNPDDSVSNNLILTLILCSSIMKLTQMENFHVSNISWRNNLYAPFLLFAPLWTKPIFKSCKIDVFVLWPKPYVSILYTPTDLLTIMHI